MFLKGSAKKAILLNSKSLILFLKNGENPMTLTASNRLKQLFQQRLEVGAEKGTRTLKMTECLTRLSIDLVQSGTVETCTEDFR